jgi:hypothetical protein
MGPIASCGVVFTLVLGSAGFGMGLRRVLPYEHVNPDTKDTVRLVAALVSTLIALVLGLMIGSAKTFYDTQSSELIQMSAQASLLDRVLAHYGPESRDARRLLRSAVAGILENSWSNRDSAGGPENPAVTGTEALYDAVEQLSPRTDSQRLMQSQAMTIMTGLGQIRWLMFEQSVSRMPRELFAVIVFWLCVLFLSYGLFAPPHATMIAGLVLCALSVAGAILVILELYDPYHGLIQVSSAPVRAALEHLGQ